MIKINQIGSYFFSNSVTSFLVIFIMPSCAAIGCVNRSEKNPSLSFNQILSNKRKEIRQEWFRRIKRGQNEKYLPKDSTLICSEHFEKDELYIDLLKKGFLIDVSCRNIS